MQNAKNLILDYYHCSFFLPLRAVDENVFETELNRFYYDPVSNKDLAEREAQAYRYFSPTMRKLLFDFNDSPKKGKNKSNLQAIKEWRLPEQIIESWQLHLGKEEHKEDHTKYQRSKIVSVRLLQYFNGIYLLTFRVEPQALITLRERHQQNPLPLFNNNQPITLALLCQTDPENRGLYEALIMENWLHFTRNTRLLYPTFPQQNDENKIVPIHLIRDNLDTTSSFKDKIKKIEIYDDPNADFSPVIIEILKAFTKKPNKITALLKNETYFYDDRMFTSTAYGIAGEPLPTESLKRLNTLVTYVDREEDTFESMNRHVYTPEVIQTKAAEHAFSLWEGLGGYYSYTGYSNSYLYNGYAFRNFIAPDHIPHIYDRMLIQALFYQASLRHYDDLICQETRELIEKIDLQAMREQRKAYIQFTNQYWFHNLTEQMQGKEIFSLQQNALKLKEHYEILKDQLERTEEYLQTEHEGRVRQLSQKLTRYGLIFAFLALYYAAIPIISNALKSPCFSLWSYIAQWTPFVQYLPFSEKTTGLLMALFFIPLGLILVFFIGNRLLKKIRS